MAEITLKPGASLDDAHQNTSTQTVDTTNTKVSLLQGNPKEIGGFRFPNVAIPVGSVIESVVFSFTTFGTSQIDHDLAFQNIANAPNFSADDLLNDRTYFSPRFTLTLGQRSDGTTITWSSATYPGMVSDIQTIIDKVGWASGNAIMCAVFPKSAQTNAAGARAYDLSPGSAATLVITFTPPSKGFTALTPAGSRHSLSINAGGVVLQKGIITNV